MIFRASGEENGHEKKKKKKKKGSEMTNQLSVPLCKYKCNYGSVNWFDSLERGRYPLPPVFTINSQNM